MGPNRWVMMLMCIVMVSGCAGCGAWNKQLDKLPPAEFESFEWHRGGNATSADIVATDARIADGKLSIGNISITENWGPFFTLNVSLKGYKRALPQENTVLTQKAITPQPVQQPDQ